MTLEIHYFGDKTRMKMLINRLLSLILFALISGSAAAGEVFWVIGSFLDEDVARVDGSRISNDTGIEVLLFKSIVNSKVQYRLLTGVLVAPSDQADLRQELMKAGVPDPWTLRFDDAPPYMETVFSDEGTGNALSAAELAEIDSMLSDFDDGYAEGALMEMNMATEDISSGLVSATSVGLAVNFVVVGSYGSAENANDYVSELGNALPEVLSHDVTVQRKEVSGEIVHRVMIGPLLPIEEKALMGSLSEWGVRGAWLLPGITAPINISLQGSGQDTSQPQRGFRIAGQSGSESSVTSVKSSREQDDFNLIRLGRGSAKFPDPRNKH
jgi:hypothetical protein